MRLWKVTHTETEKVVWVMSERWADVRSFSAVFLETGGDFGKLLIEGVAPFPANGRPKRLVGSCFRIEWKGQAASNPSTLTRTERQCNTIEELYGDPPAAKKPGKKKRKK